MAILMLAALGVLIGKLWWEQVASFAKISPYFRTMDASFKS